MSIVIMGMEMPKDGYRQVFITAEGKVFYYPSSPKNGMLRFKAFAIPTHVDLIDRDALWVEIDKICVRRAAGIITDFTCLHQLLSAVRHAPTIIQADKEAQ